VRIGAFTVLVFYHVGMVYVSWDWHFKSPHASTLLEPWMRLTSPWRMDLLFLVSGAATSFMLLRGGPAGALLRALLTGVQQWCAIVAVLGFARMHLNRDSPTLRYLNDAVFPVYILHQTVIVLLVHWIGPWQWGPVHEGVLLVVASFAVGLTAFAGIRRVAWLRPWFGVRSTDRQAHIARRASA
jgi:hypothetical protein